MALSRRGFMILGYALACFVLLLYTFGDEDNAKGGVASVVSGGGKTSVDAGKKEPAVPKAKNTHSYSSESFTLKSAAEWKEEDRVLTNDLPFLKRTDEVEKTLEKINSAHREKIALAYPDGKLKAGHTNEDQIHLFFTTDCTQHSLWQSLSLEKSWSNVNHPGAISRLVSGCILDDGSLHKNQRLLERNVIDHEKAFIFFGPRIDAGAVPGPKGSFERYAPINRPATVYYWLMVAHPPEYVLGLLDPDMIFLKPLDFPPVTLGKPAGQYYDYLVSEDWDRVYPEICQGCQALTGKADFCPGPPHLMHKKDWNDVVQWWLRYTVEARKKWGKWVSEMAGMSIALSRLNLRTKIEKNGMWDRPNAEFVATMKKYGLHNQNCDALKPNADHLPLGVHPIEGADLPSIFHYCFTPEIGRDTINDKFWTTNRPQEKWENDNQRPLLDYVHWSKYRVPGDWPGGDGGIPKDGTLLDCSQELLFEYPPITYMIKHFGKTPNDRMWAVFINSVVPNINAAVLSYRARYCKNPRKYRRNIRSSHPTSWKSKWEISYNTSNANGFTFIGPQGDEVKADWEEVAFKPTV